jgi:hypothetical protein
MGFKRSGPPIAPTHRGLTAAMAGIGMGFAATGTEDPNIEDTLYFASQEAMDAGDLRVLAVLVTWFSVHHAWVNADRLITLARNGSKRVRALWAALAKWQSKDRRYARLTQVYLGARVDVLASGSDFQIRRHGEDPRFIGTSIRVPQNVIRDRTADVSSPNELAKNHSAYRNRAIMGPSYRADLWAELTRTPEVSCADLARKTYASFASAWNAKRDFAIVRGS